MASKYKVGQRVRYVGPPYSTLHYSDIGTIDSEGWLSGSARPGEEYAFRVKWSIGTLAVYDKWIEAAPESPFEDSLFKYIQSELSQA